MKYAFMLFLFFLNASVLAQDVIEYKGEKINALDEQGRKDGIWKVYDEANGIVIVTEFTKGHVVTGPMYYKDSVLMGGVKNGQIEIYREGKTIEAHTESERPQALIDNEGNEIDEESYKYLFVAVYSMFYGGTTTVYDFIGKNFNYKSLKGQKGNVKVGFVIDVTGRTSEIKILESTNHKLDDEVIRVISILPRCQPAHQNGAFVKSSYNLPININRSK
jgi:TonB family protein